MQGIKKTIFIISIVVVFGNLTGTFYALAQEPSAVNINFDDPTEDQRFCQIYSQFANPIFGIGLIIIVIGIIGAGALLVTSRANPETVNTARRLLGRLIIALIVLLVVTKLPQSIYNLATAGKFQSSCF